MPGTLHVEIITAERVVYKDDVNMVVAPGSEGRLGILPRHAALMTTLGIGELRMKKGNDEVSIAVSGGYLEVLNNKVTILADSAEHAEEIDLARAEEARKRAQERIKARSSDIDMERALTSMRRAEVRIKIAQRRRRPPTIQP